MKSRVLTKILFCLLSHQFLIAQSNSQDPRKPDMVNFGPGIGFDYGGFGANLMVYPQKNIGIFFGGGYALAGFGYNTGIKLRLSPDRGTAVNPFFTAMYGYNAVVYIADNTQFNKLFYGPTLGAGIDIRSRKPSSKGFWSLALMVPLRSADAQNYIDFLKNTYGASFTTDLIPVGFSVGYKFIPN